MLLPPRAFPPLFSAPLKKTPVKNVEDESFNLLANDSLDVELSPLIGCTMVIKYCLLVMFTGSIEQNCWLGHIYLHFMVESNYWHCTGRRLHNNLMCNFVLTTQFYRCFGGRRSQRQGSYMNILTEFTTIKM